MYARGAIPESVGCPENVVAFVPLSPAAIPATCVPCSLFSGSNGRFAYFHCGVGGANARATITFAVVYATRSEEHTSELQSPCNLVCRLLLEKKKKKKKKFSCIKKKKKKKITI